MFKKTLVQSLHEEEESPQPVARVAPKVLETASFSSRSLAEDDDVGSYPTKSSQQSQLSETGSTVTELVAVLVK
ncbi:hypothetical protein Cni_G17557 [Canna indica]|uniref:Uncharacterized protein n=1 Tax=Canna indica TaxID=4628 RepID=A0AAQ3QF91_9LILI|nr:hypothetical protein Cni_G17557 [Canna indica]